MYTNMAGQPLAAHVSSQAICFNQPHPSVISDTEGHLSSHPVPRITVLVPIPLCCVFFRMQVSKQNFTYCYVLKHAGTPSEY